MESHRLLVLRSDAKHRVSKDAPVGDSCWARTGAPFDTAAPPPARPLDQDRTKIVDVGHRRAGDDEVAEGGEDGIGVVVVEARPRVEPKRAGASERVRRHDCAGVVLAAIDAVGVGGESENSVAPLECDRQRERELAVAAAAAFAPDRHRRLAAGEENARRANRLAISRG